MRSYENISNQLPVSLDQFYSSLFNVSICLLITFRIKAGNLIKLAIWNNYKAK